MPDTEGAGRFRGAPSLYVEYGPVDTELEVLYAADGTINPALGVRGGESRRACARPMMRTRRRRARAARGAWGHVVLEPGETIVSISAAGGGYGPPHAARPGAGPARRRRRLGQRRAGARRSTASCSREDGSVDEAGTAERRRRLEEGGAGPDWRSGDAALSLVDSNPPPRAGGARPASSERDRVLRRTGEGERSECGGGGSVLEPDRSPVAAGAQPGEDRGQVQVAAARLAPSREVGDLDVSDQLAVPIDRRQRVAPDARQVVDVEEDPQRI